MDGVQLLKAIEPVRRSSLLFTTKFPDIPGTHLIDLDRVKVLVDLGATKWFWALYLWVGNPATWGYSKYKHDWAISIYQELTDRHIWKKKQKQKPTLFLTKQCWSPRYKVSVLSLYGGVTQTGSLLPVFNVFWTAVWSALG